MWRPILRSGWQHEKNLGKSQCPPFPLPLRNWAIPSFVRTGVWKAYSWGVYIKSAGSFQGGHGCVDIEFPRGYISVLQGFSSFPGGVEKKMPSFFLRVWVNCYHEDIRLVSFEKSN